MLAKILSQRHGFKTTVLFSMAADGTIDPNNQKSLSAPEQLDTAEGIVILTRFRHWSDDATKHFVDAQNRGVPIIGLRTATHAFSGYDKAGAFANLNWNDKGGWGKAVLGETWVSHWGSHKNEATKGIIEDANKGDDLLKGVADIFGLTDVYEAHPPADAKILVRGQSLKGMLPDAATCGLQERQSRHQRSHDARRLDP